MLFNSLYHVVSKTFNLFVIFNSNLIILFHYLLNFCKSKVS